MEGTLRSPTGTLPQLPPKDVPSDLIEAWRAEWGLELQCMQPPLEAPQSRSKEISRCGSKSFRYLFFAPGFGVS
jgi:hypothetical protein